MSTFDVKAEIARVLAAKKIKQEGVLMLEARIICYALKNPGKFISGSHNQFGNYPDNRKDILPFFPSVVEVSSNKLRLDRELEVFLFEQSAYYGIKYYSLLEANHMLRILIFRYQRFDLTHQRTLTKLCQQIIQSQSVEPPR